MVALEMLPSLFRTPVIFLWPSAPSSFFSLQRSKWDCLTKCLAQSFASPTKLKFIHYIEWVGLMFGIFHLQVLGIGVK